MAGVDPSPFSIAMQGNWQICFVSLIFGLKALKFVFIVTPKSVLALDPPTKTEPISRTAAAYQLPKSETAVIFRPYRIRSLWERASGTAPEFMETPSKFCKHRKSIRLNGNFVVTIPQNVSLSDA